jgi:hypothetical protein
MTASTPNFARIGRSFPSEAFEPLYQASLAAKADRRQRAASWDGSPSKVWRGSGEAMTLPLRLPV